MQLLTQKLYANSSHEAHFLLRHFQGRLLTPQELARGTMLYEDPTESARDRIELVREPGLDWSWKFHGRTHRPADLAGELLTLFLERRRQ